MFSPTTYLRWARRFYGRVELDLASSGMAAAPLSELGPLPALDDLDSVEKLRDRIARYNRVAVGEALPTLGTTHALWTAYSALLSPGDEVLVERPTYEPMYRIPEGLGARVTWFERPSEDGFALDPERVAAALTPRTRLIALSNLHNPSGARASDEALCAVAELAERNGAHLLVDEVYAPFDATCDESGTWGGSARRLGGNVVVASSLTKVYGLGALRLGWLLGPSEVVARGDDAVLSNLGHPPLSWSAMGVAAFDRLPALAARARGLLDGKRARVEAWIAARPRFTWSNPREGLFGFALDAQGKSLTATIERAAAEAGVLVAAGEFFGVPNGFRLSWSIDGSKLDEGLDRLARALE